jgi:hypothetical protein
MIYSGRRDADGMKRIKCRTGSFEVLDATCALLFRRRKKRTKVYSHNVHSAELTKTVRSSGVIPKAVSTGSGLKANGA